MLERTLNTTYGIGSNLREGRAAANWLYLLPRIEFDVGLYIGEPSSHALAVLSTSIRAIRVVCATRAARERIAEVASRERLKNVTVQVHSPCVPVNVCSWRGDLVVLAEKAHVRRFLRDENYRAAVNRLLEPQGVIYVEVDCSSGIPKIDETALDKRGKSEILRVCHLVPKGNGPHEGAVETGERETLRFLRRQRSSEMSLRRRIRETVTQVVQRSHQGFVIRRTDDASTMVSRNTRRSLSTGPPEYIRKIAQRFDIDLDGYRWALSATGQYRSRKVLFFLFRPEARTPEYIVKLTRESRFNSRLENEHHVLEALAKDAGQLRMIVPRPVFFGNHAGRFILAETAVDGGAFRRCAQATSTSRHYRKAIASLTALGMTALDPSGATQRVAVSGLRRLWEQYRGIYKPAADVDVFMERQFSILESYAETVPAVVQHGDPGPWNMLVTREGNIALLDWEAAELSGMPFWDLFYFLRSYGLAFSRRLGTRDRVAGFMRALFTNSSFRSIALEAMQRYQRHVRIESRLIEPLFYMCWMHRALKEAARLDAHSLRHGRFASLLETCIAQRRSAPVRSFFEHSSGRARQIVPSFTTRS